MAVESFDGRRMGNVEEAGAERFMSVLHERGSPSVSRLWSIGGLLKSRETRQAAVFPHISGELMPIHCYS